MEEIARFFIGTYDGALMGYTIHKSTEQDGNDVYEAKIMKSASGDDFRITPHDGAIRFLKASGKILASSGYDGTIALFDHVNLRSLGSLHNHEDSVDSLDFYSDKYLVTASADKTICLFRTKDWYLMKTFKGHTGSVTSVAVANCGKFMLSVGRDNVIRMWDLMRAHNASVLKLAIPITQIGFCSGDENFWIVGGEKNQHVIVMNGPTQKPIRDFFHPSPVVCVSIDGDDMWVGCANGSIFGWNIEKEEKYGEYCITEKRIKYIKVSKGYILVLTSDGQIIFGKVHDNYDIDSILEDNIGSRITTGEFIC